LSATHGRPRIPKRNLLFVAAGLGLAAAVYFGWLMRANDPNFYEPARSAVVDVRFHLSEIYAHEAAAIEQLRLVHRDLGDALDQLSKAALLDTEDRQELEQLKARLQELEKAAIRTAVTPDQLKHSYRALSHDLDALIGRLEHRK
jgi:hypothetical protein